MLNHSQAALWRVRRRTGEVGKERHVVIRRVERGMVEDIKRVSFKAKPEALLDGKLLGQAHIEAHLEGPAEHISARTPVERLVKIASTGVARRNSVRARRDKLRCKIVGIKHRTPRINASGALQLCLLRTNPGFERHQWVPDIVAGAEIQASHRTRKIIHAVWLAALGDSLPANDP